MSKREMALFRKSIVGMALACAVLMLGLTAAHAQPAGPTSPPPRDGGDRGPATADLAKTLKLTPKQTPDVEAILAAERKEIQALREAMRTKADALHEATKKKLAKLLNAEQMGRYVEWREANRPPRPEGGPPGGPPPRRP